MKMLKKKIYKHQLLVQTLSGVAVSFLDVGCANCHSIFVVCANRHSIFGTIHVLLCPTIMYLTIFAVSNSVAFL
jgi:hypothetical protein